jgi:hypothetical protein
VVDEVRADRVVPVREEGDLQLRADPVGAGHEDGIAHAGGAHVEQATERSDLREHPRRERAAGEPLDAPDGLVAGVDVDT